MKKILSLFKKSKPGAIYAFNKGIYAAKMFVLIYSEKEKYHFLILPDNLCLSLDSKEFTYYKTTRTCDFIEVLPEFVFSTCKAQYLKNITSA